MGGCTVVINICAVTVSGALDDNGASATQYPLFYFKLAGNVAKN
jgi:hypothetical protein